MTEIMFQKVVKKYREDSGHSLRGFADALNEKLINTDISHATIANWENKPIEPDNLRFFFECLATYEDWRRAFAADSLCAMFPDLVESGLISFKLPLAG
jgi:hypothetical protein